MGDEELCYKAFERNIEDDMVHNSYTGEIFLHFTVHNIPSRESDNSKEENNEHMPFAKALKTYEEIIYSREVFRHLSSDRRLEQNENLLRDHNQSKRDNVDQS